MRARAGGASCLGRGWQAVLAALVLVLLPASAFAETGVVLRIVDGDTVEVQLDPPESSKEIVRLVGVDTPETSHPKKEVEEFGRASRSFLEGAALDQKVRLERDPRGRDQDKYGRLLRYVYLEDGSFLNAKVIASGHGHVLADYPFDHMEEFRELEKQAREKGRGLWAAAATDQPAPRALLGEVERDDPGAAPAIDIPPPSVAMRKAAEKPTSAAETVYVTRTGKKYHREGCRHLASSAIAMALEEAASGYQPCSVCSPPSASGSGSPTTMRSLSAPAPRETASGQCAATTKKGTRCSRRATAGSRYCWQHAR